MLPTYYNPFMPLQLLDSETPKKSYWKYIRSNLGRAEFDLLPMTSRQWRGILTDWLIYLQYDEGWFLVVELELMRPIALN